jgi:hypothetical protein
VSDNVKILTQTVLLPVPRQALEDRGAWPSRSYEVDFHAKRLVREIADAMRFGAYDLDEPYPCLRIELRVQVRERPVPAPRAPQDGVPALVNVHHISKCAGRPCCIHNPSGHHMVEWPMHWREDRYLMERICEHGIGHPDPDHLKFVDPMGIRGEAIHGCDGCCHA